ncbi:hypothetical protein ABZ590_38560, partial [Streptomyces hirsutus]|uniref:hypothetical protein n=1 Tax=Streptomyces hirsutus TaxID=35620 RepID=UPI0033E8C616
AVVGPGLDPGSQLGPVNNAPQLARVERYTNQDRYRGRGPVSRTARHQPQLGLPPASGAAEGRAPHPRSERGS